MIVMISTVFQTSEYLIDLQGRKIFPCSTGDINCICSDATNLHHMTQTLLITVL